MANTINSMTQVSGLNYGGIVQDRMATQTTGSRPGGPPIEHACELCERKFRSVRGLGQHKRSRHADRYNDQINVERFKRRWLLEEVRLMAEMEARATIDGIRFLNKHLCTLIPDRTLEAIRGKRRCPEYRVQVTSFIASLQHNLEAEHQTDIGSSVVGESQRDRLIEEIRMSVEQMKRVRNKYARALQELGEAALRGEHMDEAVLSHAIKSMFSATSCPKGPRHSNVFQYNGSKKQRRRQQYARVQKLYKSDTKAAARVILDNTDQTSVKLPPVEEVFQSWSDVFQDGEGMPGDLVVGADSEKESMRPLWEPVTIDEVGWARVANESAAGPDGISPASWNRLSCRFKRLIYNLFMFYENVPREFKVSRTVFIPKVEGGSEDPGDLRPLTICSVVLRGFNKILAKRLVALHDFDERQYAYLPKDGVGACVFGLSGLIANAREKLEELHIAGLDICKAFPSLKHKDVITSQIEAGSPKGFVNYIRNMYTNVKTLMQFEGNSKLTQMNKGVYQGDPISGPAFTMSLEGMLKAMSSSVGIDINGVRVNASAYADDTNLYAGTRKGLQVNIDKYSEEGRIKGQEVSAKKSWTLSLVPSGVDGKMKVVTGKPFTVNGDTIKELTIMDLWRYLGVNYQSNGPELVSRTMEEDLKSLSKGPLKPQQRLHMLKAYVIPRYQDKLVLSRTTATGLRRMDVQIGRYVRKWLSLPHDVPVAYLHAPVRAGGLGVPCLRVWIPLIRLNRLRKAVKRGDQIMMALSDCNLFKSIIHACMGSLACLGTDEPTQVAYHAYWRERLVEKVDGKDLEHAWAHKSSTSWNNAMSGRISGEDYVHYQQIRANALPTRVRTARGRPAKETWCRGGCRRTETAQHVIQECHRTHGVRVRRHDRVVDILGEELRKRGRLFREQEIQTVRGLRKPDLILVKDDTAHVLDVQVVKCGDLNGSHVAKVGKYEIPDIERHLKAKYGVTEVKCHACTLSFKGIWCPESVTELKRLGVSEYCLFKIVTSTLRGTWLCWRQFNSVTFMRD